MLSECQLILDDCNLIRRPFRASWGLSEGRFSGFHIFRPGFVTQYRKTRPRRDCKDYRRLSVNPLQFHGHAGTETRSLACISTRSWLIPSIGQRCARLLRHCSARQPASGAVTAGPCMFARPHPLPPNRRKSTGRWASRHRPGTSPRQPSETVPAIRDGGPTWPPLRFVVPFEIFICLKSTRYAPKC